MDVEYNTKKLRAHKIKKDVSRKSKIPNKGPKNYEQNLSKTGTSNVTFKNEKPQNKSVNHQTDLEQDSQLAQIDLSNLKRETDEIRLLTQKARKSLRFVTSNWDRCENQPKCENLLRDNNDSADFTHLLDASGGHFRFKHEHEWDVELSVFQKKPMLKPNTLNGFLACIPIEMKLNIPNFEISNDEREEIHNYTKNSISTFNIKNRNKNDHILQEKFKVDGSKSKPDNILGIISSSSDLDSTYMKITSASENKLEDNLVTVSELYTDECLEDGKEGAKVYEEITVSNIPQVTSSVTETQTVGSLLHKSSLNENIITEICQNVKELSLEIGNCNAIASQNGATSEDINDMFDDDLEFLLSLKKPVPETTVNQSVALTNEGTSINGISQFITNSLKSSENLDAWLESLCTDDD